MYIFSSHEGSIVTVVLIPQLLFNFYYFWLFPAMAEKTQMMVREMGKLVEKMEDRIEALAANFNNIG